MVALARAGTYKAVITNDIGSDTSTTADIGVVDLAAKSVTITEDKTLTLTVTTAAPIGKSFTYQWKKNNAPLSRKWKHWASPNHLGC